MLSSTILYVMIMNCCGVFHNSINFLITESVYSQIAHARFSFFHCLGFALNNRIRKIEGNLSSKCLMGNNLSFEGVGMSGTLPLQSQGPEHL